MTDLKISADSWRDIHLIDIEYCEDTIPQIN